MNAVSRRGTCLICAVMALLMLSIRSTAETRKEAADFYQWLASDQGQKASLDQMKQQCEKVLDAGKNLDCSVSVFARMFETKAANKIPDYYLATKRRHAQVIAKDAELNALFSMFGSESISMLRAVGDFSVQRTRQPEVLTIHLSPVTAT